VDILFTTCVHTQSLDFWPDFSYYSHNKQQYFLKQHLSNGLYKGYAVCLLLVAIAFLIFRPQLFNNHSNGRTILRWIFSKWEGVETGWSWLRIGTGGGPL
jgi:hypothetical protein